MLYFAYGSNMNWDQMRERCPSAKFVCIARLTNHRLVFPRKSDTRGCGVSSVEAAKNGDVWGVVFQIDELDVGRLDKREGYNPILEPERNSYVRKEIRVDGDGDNARPLTVFTCVANHQPGQHRPSAEYERAIVEGAKFWHLPADYLKKLEAIATSEPQGHGS